ncbi:MAG: hypothetical protein MUC85_07960 [Anaerolineales bacterium]|jgi:hypothetical protein|nr:hypothetical protein [Anaerolineales bacterium]
MNQPDLDLTEYVSGFPEKPDYEVPRDAIIRNIVREFGLNRQIMAVAHPQTGKSNLMAQFAREHKDCAISYFITSNPWTQQQHTFLYTMCHQLRRLLGKQSLDETIEVSALKTIFTTQCAALAELAKEQKKTYYFIIDGLEWALTGLSGERIIDIFPTPTYPRSPYLLFTCDSNKVNLLQQYVPNLGKRMDFSLEFNFNDTQHYLSNLNLSDAQIENIHKSSLGVPEYLKIIRDEIRAKGSAQWNLEKYPQELDQLIQAQLSKFYSLAEPKIIKAIEYIAICPAPVPTATLCTLCNIGNEELVGSLKKWGFIRLDDKKSEITCQNDIIRNALKKRIGNKTQKMIHEMIDNLRAAYEPNDFLLTVLLNEAKDYQGTKELVTNQNILSSFSLPLSNTSVISKRLALASTLAHENQDMNGLLRYTLGEVIVKSLLTEIDEEGEIRALIAIGDAQLAIKKAYGLPEVTARIRLLAKAYTSQKGQGEKITKEARDELQGMVENLKVDELEKDVAIQIALDIFPILPDQSVQLLDKLIGRSEKRGVLDAAYTTIALNSKTMPSESFFSSINDSELGLFARVYSNWLQGLSIQSLEKEVKEIVITAAREYLIRQWCRQNSKSEELAQGISMWIDTIVNDINYTVPLSNLRYIAFLLGNISDLNERVRLISKIEIPGFMSLESPWEEWVRFHLNLASASFAIDTSKAIDKICFVHETIDNKILDADIKIICLANLWATSVERIPEDQAFISKVKADFESTFTYLKENTAEHYEIFTESLTRLVSIDPELALEKALELNVHERRIKITVEILETTLKKYPNTDISNFLSLCFDRFIPLQQDLILSALLENLGGQLLEITGGNLEFLLGKVEKISDPYHKSSSLTNLLRLVDKANEEIKDALVEKAIDAWRLEEDLKIRINFGFFLVESLAPVDLRIAQSLCAEIQSLYLQPGSVLAVSHLGSSYYETVRLAIRALNLHDLIKIHESELKFTALIERIPAKRVRVELFARLIARAYKLNYPILAERLIHSDLLPQLAEISSSYDEMLCLHYSIPVIYKYDSKKAIELASKYPPIITDQFWSRTIMWLLVMDELDQRFNAETLRFIKDRPTLSMCVELVARIERDFKIYECVKAISNCIEVSYKNKLDALQALSLLKDLENSVEIHLPDQNNIKHVGYKVIALAAIHSVRTVIYVNERNRRGLNKQDISTQWNNIQSMAASIANQADHIFVLCAVAKDIVRYKREESIKNLQEADQNLLNVPSLVDRVDLQQLIGSSYAYIGEKSLAQFNFEKEAELLVTLDQTSRDQKIASLVQAAHKVSPEYADQLVTRLDQRSKRDQVLTTAEINHEIQKLVGSPTLLSTKKERDEVYDEIVRASANQLMADLVSDRGTIPHEQVLMTWVYSGAVFQRSTYFDIMHWVIESLHQKSSTGSNLNLGDTYADMASFIFELAKLNSPIRREGIPDAIQDSLPGLQSRYEIFKPGESEKAKKWLTDWLASNAKQYLKICDPYFGPDEIEYLKHCPENLKILIITTDCNFDLRDGPQAIAQSLELTWNRISARKKPLLQVIIVPKTFEDAFHDRAITTQGGGLDMGQSLNGLGKKFGKIGILTNQEAKELETSYIDLMLSQASWFMNHGVSPTIIDLH